MDSSPHLIFKSDGFAPVLGEDEETNPGIFGKALVEWLAEALAARGYAIDRTLPEDFGRLVQLKEPSFSLYVAASSTDETATEWRVLCFAEAELLARLKGKGAERAAKVRGLFEALQAILSADPRVRDLHSEN
jgi:hypothetical protein